MVVLPEPPLGFTTSVVFVRISSFLSLSERLRAHHAPSDREKQIGG
jgi:hypothetical protein